jgi:P27 family predicted phage terminase small subunit
LAVFLGIKIYLGGLAKSDSEPQKQPVVSSPAFRSKENGANCAICVHFREFRMPPPGPPPIPLIVHRLRGNPSKKKLPSGPEPALLPKCPEPPSFLSQFAQDEWWRVAPELWALGLLTVLDTGCLAAYCQTYAHWRTAEEALARVAERDTVTHGLLIKTTDGNARRNPLVKVAADAANDMVRYAGEFGLTAVARSRLAGGVHGQPGPSKFHGLLAGPDEG